MKELEKEAAEMEEPFKSSNDERKMLKKERTSITERVRELEAAYERKMQTKKSEKEKMMAAHQRKIKDHKMTSKYWLKSLPIIDMQSKKYLARANRLIVELAAAKKN